MKTNKTYKILSIILSLLLVLSLLPVSAQAAVDGEGVVTPDEGETFASEAAAIEAGATVLVDGTTYFDTLAHAIAAAPTNLEAPATTTIKLLVDQDATMGSSATKTGYTISAGKRITLDLNDCTIRGIVAYNGATDVIYVNAGAYLEIADNGDEGAGLIANVISGNAQVGEWWNLSFSTNYATNIVNNRGTLVINGGTLKSNGAGSICFAIDAAGGSTTIINGGHVDDDYGSTCRFACGYTGSYSLTLEIHGGTVGNGVAKTSIWFQLPSGDTAPDCTVNFVMDGGTILSNGGNSFYDTTQGQGYAADYKYSVSGGFVQGQVFTYADAVAVGDFTGGYYTMDVSDYTRDGYICVPTDDEYAEDYPYMVVEAVSYEGSPVAQIDETPYYTLYSALNAAQANDTVTLLTDVTLSADDTIYINTDLTLDLNEHVINNGANYGLRVHDDVSVEVVNGSIFGDGRAFTLYDGATLTLNNAHALSTKNDAVLVTGNNAAIISKDDSVNSIDAISDGCDGIYIDGGLNTEINGNGALFISGIYSGIHVNGSDDYEGYGTYTVVNYPASLTVNAPNMKTTGNGHGLRVDASSRYYDLFDVGGSWNSYSHILPEEKTYATATLCGGYYDDDVSMYTADGYVSVIDVSVLDPDPAIADEAMVTPFHVVPLTSEAPVARVNDSETPYYTLASALIAADNGDTVTLLADAPLPYGGIAIGKSITLDLDGHFALLGLGAGIVVDSGTALTIDNSGFDTGRFISVGNSLILRNGSELTLKDAHVLSIFGDTVLVEGNNAKILAAENSENYIEAAFPDYAAILIRGAMDALIDGPGWLTVSGVDSGIHVYGYEFMENEELCSASASLTVDTDTLWVSADGKGLWVEEDRLDSEQEDNRAVAYALLMGGYYDTNNALVFAAEGYTAVANENPADMGQYPWHVVKKADELEDVNTAVLAGSTPDIVIDGPVLPEVQEVVDAINNGEVGGAEWLETAAANVANNAEALADALSTDVTQIAPEDIAQTVEAELVGVLSDIPEGAWITLVVEPYFDVALSGVTVQSEDAVVGEPAQNASIVSLTVDITPMYNLIATTAEFPEDIVLEDGGTVEQNAIYVAEGLHLNLPEGTVIEIKLPIPANLANAAPEGEQGDKHLFVLHKGYQYDANVFEDEQNPGSWYASFVNPHGFSEFVLTRESAAVARICNEYRDDYFTDLQAAVNAVDNGETIFILRDTEETAYASGPASFYVVVNQGVNNAGEILAASGFNLSRKQQTPDRTLYTVSRNIPSGGAASAEPEEEGLSTDYADCAKDNACPISDYSDTDPAEWYHDGVHFCLENELMAGENGSFRPAEGATRAEIVQILFNLEGQPETEKDAGFSDVASDAAYAPAIRWAAENGIVLGCGDGTFRPDDPVTREQLAAIFFRYAVLKGYSTADAAELGAYPDAADVSSWAESEMQWAVGCGMIDGRLIDGTAILAPQEGVTRAESATMALRFCLAFVK